jgi:hypothetical protein
MNDDLFKDKFYKYKYKYLDLLNQEGGNPTNCLPKGKAVLYSEKNFTGTKVCINEGSYTRQELKAKGLDNNTISSVKIPKGHKLILFDKNNFNKDDKKVIKAIDEDNKINNLNNWDDKISSLKFIEMTQSRSSSPSSPVKPKNCGQKGQVAFFANQNFNGNKICLKPGRYSKNDLEGLGFKNNSISSIRTNGHKVTMYNNQFTGFEKTISSNISSLQSLRMGSEKWNNKISSLVIHPKAFSTKVECNIL